MSKRKTFIVHYYITIKDPKEIDLILWERATMEIEADNLSSIDTDVVKERIRQIAKDKAEYTEGLDIDSNYFKIVEKRKKRKRRSK